MLGAHKHVLIMDNATTCAMRIKTLIHIHGAKAKVMHWSEWDRLSINEMTNLPSILIIEQTVPLHIVRSVVDTLSNLPLFILYNPNKSLIPWPIEQQVNPLSSALSNFELVSVLEPYWLEEKTIILPNVVILDDTPDSAHQVTKMLSNANIPCNWIQTEHLNAIQNVDLVMINITQSSERLSQLKNLKKAFPLVGIIAYGQREKLSEYELVKQIVKLKVDDILDINDLRKNWLPSFRNIWQRSAQLKEERLVTSKIQNSFDNLLEKSLISEVLMANSMDGIVAFSEDGKILKYNDGFCELLGLIDEQVKESNVFVFLSMQSQKELKRLLPSDYLFQQQVIDLHLLHEHGVSIPVSASVNRINFHGNYVYVVVMRNNVNQQLQKKILVQQNAQLEHKVKDVVRAKELFTELTRKNKRKQNTFMEKFTRFLIEQCTTIPPADISNKLNNLNLIHRIEAAQISTRIETVNLKQKIKHTLLLLDKLVVKQRIDIHLDVNSEFNIQFTEEHLNKLLFELIHNAIIYNLEGGELTIVASPLSEHRIELNVIDRGIGIIEHKQNQLFDLCEINDDPSAKTCCTGLPLCKLLVNLNNADIYVNNHYENDKVVGTIFSVIMAIK